MLADRAHLHSPALLHHEPLALFIGEAEYAHRSGFGHLAAWGLYDPEELRTLFG
jgi:hypothetical protein